MNEKEFLKKIKSKYNRTGENTTLTVIDFLKQNKISIPTLITRVYNKIFNKNSQVKTPEQIVAENFETIIGTFTDLSDDGELDIDGVLEFCDTLVEREDIKKVGKRIVTENIDKIYSMIQDEIDIFRLVQFEKKLGREIDNSKEKLLAENKLGISKYMLDLSPLSYYYTANSREKVEGYLETLSIMIDELLQSENCRYSDINYVTKGGYSLVYQIGDKMLKVGRPRHTYNIPNHRRILQPLTRVNFTDEKNNPLVCAEIQDKVDLTKKISTKELYNLYKELREDGIIWTDAKKSNIGRLIKANKATLNGEEMDVAPNSVGFIDGKNERDLPAGEWVIFDTDFIYKADDSRIVWSVDSLSQEFERKYQQEKARAISEEYMRKHQGEDIYSLPENQIRSNSEDESR